MAKIDLGFEFRRSNKKPIDVSSVWDSLLNAQNYAAGRDTTQGAPYNGQIVAVLETDGKYHGYIIQNGNLLPLGFENEDATTSAETLEIVSRELNDYFTSAETLSAITEALENFQGGGTVNNIVSDDDSIKIETDENNILHISVNKILNPEIIIE